MDKLKLISFNVKGFTCKHKRAKVLSWLNNIEYDILTIQESPFMDNDLSEWKENWKGEIIVSEGDRNMYYYVCIMIKEELEYTKLKELHDTDGRWLIIVIQIKNIEYLIASYYGPNQDKIEHITTLLDKIDELEVPNVLIGGDFNFTFNPTIDQKRHRKTQKKSRTGDPSHY